MCLIAFHFDPTRDPWLVLAANRDEFHARPTRPLAWWNGPGSLLAGRDEQAGGTWLGVTRRGRWAAVTNFRDPTASSGQQSRGGLPVAFLETDVEPEAYAGDVQARRDDYGPFNLLVGDPSSLWYVGSRSPAVAVEPGVHALSNGLLDASWPKSQRVATALKGQMNGPIDLERVMRLMLNRDPAPDQALPETGVGQAMERFLSASFIVSDSYGTRCTSAFALGDKANVVQERRWSSQGATLGELRYTWN